MIEINPADSLLQLIENNVNNFEKTKKFQDLKAKLSELRTVVVECNNKVIKIETFASDYDFDDVTPGNGYRSHIDIFNSAIRETTIVCDQLTTSRNSLLFRADRYLKYKVQGQF